MCVCYGFLIISLSTFDNDLFLMAYFMRHAEAEAEAEAEAPASTWLPFGRFLDASSPSLNYLTSVFVCLTFRSRGVEALCSRGFQTFLPTDKTD
jgi:hypothetical protein